MPVETRLQLVLAVLAHEMTVAEAARRHGVSAESINRWRNRFVDGRHHRRLARPTATRDAACHCRPGQARGRGTGRGHRKIPP